MPELPEVETILRGIRPQVEGQIVEKIIIRQPNLRFKVPPSIRKFLPGQRIHKLTRRGKYLLLWSDKGTALVHLGMSGYLRIIPKNTPVQKHDHIDLMFEGFCLRYTDPRRFGSLLWVEKGKSHPLLEHLGVEPLEEEFTGEYLWEKSRSRKLNIKQFITHNKIVVGIGNIYSAEALFLTGIHPLTKASNLNKAQYECLVESIKKVLHKAIREGGTTFRDFQNSEGKPGYFKHHLNVYGREGKQCTKCKTLLEGIRIQNRSTVFCPKCQKFSD